MAIPHYNYYPPAGSVLDQSDGRVTWNGRAWMLNGRVYGVPSTHQLVGKPGTSMAGWSYDWQKRAWMEPSASAPVVQVTNRPRPAPQPPAHAPEKRECGMEKKGNVIESLVKHPVAPVLGGILVLAAHFTDEPAPPAIPEELPENVQKQWQMIFNQNQQRFQRRMEMYENLGMVLLGYASTQTILNALPPKKAA